jgi:preprotein translocase SecF subunit
MRLFGKTNIDFMSKRRYWYMVSAAVILAGLASVAIKGLHFGIDFLGGTELVVRFQHDVEISDVRAAIQAGGVQNAEIKSFGARSEILIRTVEQAEGTAIADRLQSALTAAFPQNPYAVLKEDKIGPKIGEELRRDALYAVIASLIAIWLYIAFRFKFVYGFGAVAALFHDVLVTLGAISICDAWLNLEIDQNMIAAFLTLIGLSVNDTVVIFDRIRENQKIHRAMPLQELMNKSINETLSRTLITMGTITAVLVVLVIWGGQVLQGFSFALLVGITTGTYSSIYIASAAALEWVNRAGMKGKLVN